MKHTLRLLVVVCIHLIAIQTMAEESAELVRRVEEALPRHPGACVLAIDGGKVVFAGGLARATTISGVTSSTTTSGSNSYRSRGGNAQAAFHGLDQFGQHRIRQVLVGVRPDGDQRLVGDDHAGGVQAGLPVQPLERHGDVEDVLRRGPALRRG